MEKTACDIVDYFSTEISYSYVLSYTAEPHFREYIKLASKIQAFWLFSKVSNRDGRRAEAKVMRNILSLAILAE